MKSRFRYLTGLLPFFKKLYAINDSGSPIIKTRIPIALSALENFFIQKINKPK